MPPPLAKAVPFGAPAPFIVRNSGYVEVFLEYEVLLMKPVYMLRQ